MNNLSRRKFGIVVASIATSVAMPAYLHAQTKPRVVVIGGGPGGATAARYIAKDSEGAIDVTLIEDSETFTTCFYSNLYLGGYRDFASITHSYEKLQANYGITKITSRATGVDRSRKEVTLQSGSTVEYDRLVVSPGIDLIWDSVPGYSEEASTVAPHAWQAGPQTVLLHDRIRALKDGDNIVMVAPPNPYRCPPGPYERASMMAHVLKAKGFKNSRIIILDTKPKFSKQGLFQEGWERHYPGMVEWISPEIHGGITKIDPSAGTVETDFSTFKGSLLNIIPAQKAGEIAQVAGLTDASGFCPIDATSMRSSIDPDIFVLGDASIAGDMPKSAFSANSQAKVAAMQIRGDLLGSKVFPARYSNTCWSLIETDDGIKVGAQYEPKDGKIASVQSFISQSDEDPAVRQATFTESVGWYAGIIADTFGG